jgi:P-aminobenzoate N-oxygenase AurF
MYQESYPHFITYDHVKRPPSVVKQTFFTEYVDDGMPLYPENQRLSAYFADESESRKFGAAMFCGFLHDTIGVEHHVVIASIMSLRELPFDLPLAVQKELYKFVTDEGHHAAQSLHLISVLKDQFGIEVFDTGADLPLFVRRLFAQRDQLSTPMEKALFTMIIGVVSETRISVELGQFASNKELTPVVREACRQHMEDEAVHASQFRALGEWSWACLAPEQKSLAAALYAKTTIARSLPDADRIAFYLSQATGRPRVECAEIISGIYTDEVLRDEMLFAAKPTLRFLKQLGVLDYPEAQKVLSEVGVSTNLDSEN